MPCTCDPDPSREQFFEACLCALARVLEEDRIFGRVDWKEAGVSSRKFYEWWKAHQLRDLERREREANDREENKLRLQAIAKLSAEERKALRL